MADLFDETKLREDVVSVWGEHGAHVIVFDHMCSLAKTGGARLAKERSLLDKVLAAIDAEMPVFPGYDREPENSVMEALGNVREAVVALMEDS